MYKSSDDFDYFFLVFTCSNLNKIVMNKNIKNKNKCRPKYEMRVKSVIETFVYSFIFD